MSSGKGSFIGKQKTLKLWDILMQIGQALPLIKGPLLGFVYLSKLPCLLKKQEAEYCSKVSA